MIAAWLTDPVHVAELHPVFAAAPIPSLLLPGVVDAATAATLRAALDAAGTTRFAVADRGRYAVNTTLRVAPLWDALAAMAAQVAATPLRVLDGRWLRFGRGDYALIKDDVRTRPAGAFVELTLDLSLAASGEAEVIYSDGAAQVDVPQLPGVLALVGRTPQVARYERPPTVRGGGGEVIRLRLALAPAGGAATPAARTVP